jgi:hypothetical protein
MTPWKEGVVSRAARKEEGMEILPFRSILFTNVDKNSDITALWFHVIPLLMGYHGMRWESMGK